MLVHNWFIWSIYSLFCFADFLILFFTEAIFYCGAAVFLILIDRLRRPKEPTYAETSQIPVPHFGDRISTVAVLVLSLLIPTVTMGFVWPWTGPAASATLAPYLVGIIVQFAFEQYARYVSSPSWPSIPIIFQVKQTFNSVHFFHIIDANYSIKLKYLQTWLAVMV